MRISDLLLMLLGYDFVTAVAILAEWFNRHSSRLTKWAQMPKNGQDLRRQKDRRL